jgi:hypothetical protein
MDRGPDGSVNIVDYKTGKARSQEDADESLQLSIYAMAAREKWGYRVGALVFHNLEGNVPVFSKRTDFQLGRSTRASIGGGARHCRRGLRGETGFLLQLLRVPWIVSRRRKNGFRILGIL